MSFYDVFVGSLEDPDFRWEGGNWDGNIPHALTPDFPCGRRGFDEVLHRIEAGIYVGKQVDWGAWVAKVDKQQVKALLDDLYVTSPPPVPHLVDHLAKVREAVERLESDRKYALVAYEAG
jgi:hypothetical protein